MRLLLEKWQNFVKEADIDPKAIDIASGMNKKMYDSKFPGYIEKLESLGLSLKDYERFSKIYDEKRPGQVVPLDKFVDNIEKIKQMYPEAFDDQQKFSSAPSKQRVEKMYNALRQMDGQMSGEKYEKAVAALNDLLRSL